MKESFRELLDLPVEGRDISWRKKFYEYIQMIPLSMKGESLGPDGFPYIQVQIILEDIQSTEGAFIKDLLDTCLEEGKGIACFDVHENIVWVFSYGSLRSFKELGNFEMLDIDSSASQSATGPDERSVMVGQPNEEFFPTYARKVVREYFQTCGITDPHVVLFLDPNLTPPSSLLFSIFPEDFPEPQQFQTIMGRLSWFFYPSRGVVSVSKEGAKDYPFESF
jgi:hypothetical protein